MTINNSLELYNKMNLNTDNSRGIPLLSFFSGAGFLDIGFMRAGFNIVWRNEYNPSFVGGFEYGMSKLGLPDSECKVQNQKSIIDIGPAQVAKEAFLNTPRPKLFGFIGGPPCPDFSVGGKNKGSDGEKGKLSEVYVNRILELQPTFFLFENVPGLLRTSKHCLFLTGLMKKLSHDYLLDINILNALEYGVPQDRERVFLIGFQKNWLKRNLNFHITEFSNDWIYQLQFKAKRNNKILPSFTPPHWFPWNANAQYLNAKNRFKWGQKNDFGLEVERPEGTPDELMVHKYICDQDEIASLENGLEGFNPKSDKFLLIPEGDDSRKSFKRLHRWRYSPAAAYGNNEVHLHPTLPRRITVREALRIQTVPDEYSLPPLMPLSHKFKTIGNGVPVKLAEAVAQSIKMVLNGEI
jgi:DNA (cytosine-5)-methyltransferase 1